jgi:hypothetical protein
MTPPSASRSYDWLARAAPPWQLPALNISPKLLYQWQEEALTPVVAARVANLDPTTAAELRQPWALARRQALKMTSLKKQLSANEGVLSQCPTAYEPLPLHRWAAGHAPRASALLGVARTSRRGLRAWQQRITLGELAWKKTLVKAFSHQKRRYGTRQRQVPLCRMCSLPHSS